MVAIDIRFVLLLVVLTESSGPTSTPRAPRGQIENARAFAAAKGWNVDYAHEYADEAISGAETSKLRARQRLIELIRSGPNLSMTA